MTLIGMPEAARRAAISPNSIRRSLANAGVPLVEINARAMAVEEADLAAFLAARTEAGYAPGRRGRPRGAKNRQKRETEGEQTE